VAALGGAAAARVFGGQPLGHLLHQRRHQLVVDRVDAAVGVQLLADQPLFAQFLGGAGGVEVVLAARRAVVHRQLQVLLRLDNVAELPVGEAEPEVELVVVVGARHLAGEELAGGAPVALPGRVEAEVEEVERRHRLDRREPRARSLGVGGPLEAVVGLGDVGEGARVLRLALEDVGEHALGLGRAAVAHVDDAERVV